MKKFLLFSAVCAALVSLTGCLKGESGNHAVQIYAPYMTNGYVTYYGYGVAYADQKVDTVSILTTDPWKIGLSDTPWLTMNEADKTTTYTYRDGYYTWAKFPVYFAQNTTGKRRDGYIYFNVYNSDGFNKTVTVEYHQSPYHCVVSPSVTYDQATETYSYNRIDSAACVKDSVKFHAFRPWSISCDNANFSLDQSSGHEGDYVVRYTMPANASESDTVNAVITIKSEDGKVVTPISVKQLPKKKK